MTRANNPGEKGDWKKGQRAKEVRFGEGPIRLFLSKGKIDGWGGGVATYKEWDTGMLVVSSEKHLVLIWSPTKRLEKRIGANVALYKKMRERLGKVTHLRGAAGLHKGNNKKKVEELTSTRRRAKTCARGTSAALPGKEVNSNQPPKGKKKRGRNEGKKN